MVNLPKLLGGAKKDDNKKGSKNTKTKTKTSKKKGGNKTSVQEATATSDDNRDAKTKGTQRRKGGKKDLSKEQATATAPSVKKPKSKNKKSSTKKTKQETTTVEETAAPQTTAQEMLNAVGLGKPPGNNTPIPPTHPKSAANAANNLMTCVEEDNTATVKADPKLVLPPLPEQGSMKPKNSGVVPPIKIQPAPLDPSVNVANSAVTPNSTLSQTDKWIGEETARAWMDKVDFEKTKQEYEKILAMPLNIDSDCKKWKANAKLNQSADDYPALDSNLATFENLYVNMSLIELPTLRNMYVGQIPLKGREEAFWKMIFEKRVVFMQIIVAQGESVDFFPVCSGDHTYFGTMFVNNRRVETVNDDVNRFAIEVLPDGCSNSIICNITIVKNWNIESVHAKQAVVIKECIDLTNFLIQTKDDMAIVVSKHGAGRPGYLISLAVAIHRMDKTTEPSFLEIVRGLRAQRPKAVETLTQYASLYISMFYFIKRKCAKTDGDKKAVADTTNDPICRKSVQLTTLFTNALIAEAAAAAGRSTITMIK